MLYVAYPLLRVSTESAGGAEQVLLTVESEMAAAGHQTTVAACNSSRVKGRLLATGPAATSLDQFERRDGEHSAKILSYLRQHPDEFDLIHDNSGAFFRHAAECPVPLLATLHLPRSFYRDEYFQELPPNVFFNCVSRSQESSFSNLSNVLGVVENGVAIEEFSFTPEKADYVLWLGRISEEKAPHLAVAAAQKAGLPLIIAGQVYPFRYHQQYFEREIQPRLARGSALRFIDSPRKRQKLDLLRRARALLVTSTAEETSSLVAMEAMACGTPVIAFRRGALPEIVADGETGFVVDSVDGMAAALRNLGQISATACRARVERRFTAKRMALEYEALYCIVLARAAERAAA